MKRYQVQKCVHSDSIVKRLPTRFKEAFDPSLLPVELIDLLIFAASQEKVVTSKNLTKALAGYEKTDRLLVIFAYDMTVEAQELALRIKARVFLGRESFIFWTDESWNQIRAGI